VDVYIPSQFYYDHPFKLGTVGKGRKRVRNTCDRFILDSGISDPSVTNEDVIDAARRLDADFVVPKDYLHKQGKTTDSVSEFFDLYADSGVDATVLVPLQPPHVSHLDDLPESNAYCVGGIAKASPDDQLQALRDVRDAVGDDVYLHGLGFGLNTAFIRTVRQHPTLVDSIDMATVEQAVKGGEVRDKWGEGQSFAYPTGDKSSIVRQSFSQAMLVMYCYMLTDHCDDEAVQPVDTQLSDWV